MRVKLTIEYDGTDYAGWQRQDGLRTVQGDIENALLALFQKSIPLTVAGRTDAGVHAHGQVAHCNIDDLKSLDESGLAKAINAHLRGAPIAIVRTDFVPEDFHARFSARNKLYRYTIMNRPAPAVLGRHIMWHVRGDLDTDQMHAAAQKLLGNHDFTSYRDAECQAKTPLRTLDRLDVIREGDIVMIEAEGKSFLHHQVRNMVGTLVDVGLGKREADNPFTVLCQRDRRLAGQTAPACGLALIRIDY